KGFKVSKRLGLKAKYRDGSWVRPDDERLDPLWAAAGEMNVPVLLHIADPIPNWRPVDGTNPRAAMLHENPEVWFGDGKHLPRLELLAMRDRVLARHPRTVFVNAHWGCYPEDLDHLVSLFETYPNFVVDTEPGKVRLAPAGKVHKSHRELLIRYADRTLFGTDLAYWAERGGRVDHAWNDAMYARQFEWFETVENGGMALPEDVLRRIYHDTARAVYRV
ncbi:MAG TPA: amidohydrolase family protein, partial [Planctomycetota bacterium]|nr:amidohydrolase family protein [Planctomycetota bacterium]